MKERLTGWQRRLTTEAVPSLGWGKVEPAADAVKALFDDGSVANGKLSLRASIRIDGEFSGTIDCDESVILGPGAAIEGSIRARSVIVLGAVVGDVTGSREVLIQSGGRLHGDVSTPSLVIERGGLFNGQSRMAAPAAAARAAAEPELATPAGIEAAPA